MCPPTIVGMRWGKAALPLALLAAACGPLFTAEAPSPSPSPAAIVRATARPTLPPRPAPTAVPVRTPRPSATATALAVPPVRTPAPTLGLPVANASCSEWPDEPEVAVAITHLSLPPSLCLLRANPLLVGRTVCTVQGCVPVTQACADAGSCIERVESEHPHFVLVWFRSPATLPPDLAEGYTMVRHLCALHQEKARLDAALRGRASPVWAATLEGQEFASAFDFFRRAYAADAERWGERLTLADDYVDVCSAWYYPYVREQKISAYQPLVLFAQKWLPKP